MVSVIRSSAFASVLRLSTVCAVLLALAACGDDGGSGPSGTVARVDVGPATPVIAIGGTAQLSAVTRDSDGDVLNGRSVTWTSLNSAVATVSQAGLVTGVTAGTAVIRATSEGRTGEVTVTVSPPSVASLTITPDSARTSATLAVGDSLALQASPRDAQGNILPGRTVTYQSSNPAVVSVSPTTGLVRAVAAGGPVTITATSDGRTATATISAVAPFVLTQVGGQNLPAPIPNVPSLVVVSGRVILYANGRYSAPLNYQTGPFNTEGTYVRSGTQITFTDSNGQQVVGTIVGNVLTRGVFTFVQ
ncbi:MAG: Ig-like domain-containing protein [Gemmatimonadota bacterium]|nr:Ig-like domain-containing protein [Gemmatimonadota bacterium]